jgi:hypothetical protein
MVNKSNNGGCQKKPGAGSADVEPPVGQQASENNLLKAIIDEWVVPALVEAYIREMTVKNGCAAEAHETKKTMDVTAYASVAIVGCKAEMQKAIANNKESD